MKMNYFVFIGVIVVIVVVSCIFVKKEYVFYELYLVCLGSFMEMEYLLEFIKFIFWVFIVDEVCLMLFDLGEGGYVYEIIFMELGEEGIWMVMVRKDLMGKFYIFNVKVNDKWMGDIFGINVKVVGVNGKCVVIINLKFIDL